MILMIDNYDSFTYNIVQYLAELKADVQVFRNDEITIADIEKLAPEKIVISPGPCTPNEAGISVEVITSFAGKLPILGVCLGHQSIAQAFGGKIIRAKQVMHGKTSLVIEQSSLPSCLEITAWTENEDGSLDEIMGIRHKEMTIEGVQFHPESILTEHGHDLLRNFLEA
jgi:anthranilate synthase component 2